jgi:hypothetical protein
MEGTPEGPTTMRTTLVLSLMLFVSLSAETAVAGHPKAPAKKAAAAPPKGAQVAKADENAIPLRLQNGDASFKLLNKSGTLTSTCTRVEGLARIMGDGTFQVMFRSHIPSFQKPKVSNPDVAAFEGLEGPSPTFEYRASAPGLRIPHNWNGFTHLKFNGTLRYHGVEQARTIDVQVQFMAPDLVILSADFPMDLESFGLDHRGLQAANMDRRLQVESQFTFSSGVKYGGGAVALR